MNVAWTWINIVLTSHRRDFQQPYSKRFNSWLLLHSTFFCSMSETFRNTVQVN